MLCQLLLEWLQALGCATAYLNAPVAEAIHLPLIVAREFGLSSVDYQEPYRELRDFQLKVHAAGRRNVLVVDEAQALGASGLELVRLLSNLETEAHKLLQIVLFGQTELDALLEQQALRQIAQRISFGFRTEPLLLSLVGAYVGFRLQRCAISCRGMDVFAPAARNLLAQRSCGWPRLINIFLPIRPCWRPMAVDSLRCAWWRFRRRGDFGHIDLLPAGLTERLRQGLARGLAFTRLLSEPQLGLSAHGAACPVVALAGGKGINTGLITQLFA